MRAFKNWQKTSTSLLKLRKLKQDKYKHCPGDGSFYVSTWVGEDSKTLFLSVSLRVFPKEISIWTNRLMKGNYFPKQVSFVQYTENQRTKRKRKREFALCLNWDTHLFLPMDIKILVPWFWCLGSRKVLKPLALLGLSALDLDKKYTIHCWFLGASSLQLENHNTSQFP